MNLSDKKFLLETVPDSSGLSQWKKVVERGIPADEWLQDTRRGFITMIVAGIY